MQKIKGLMHIHTTGEKTEKAAAHTAQAAQSVAKDQAGSDGYGSSGYYKGTGSGARGGGYYDESGGVGGTSADVPAQGDVGGYQYQTTPRSVSGYGNAGTYAAGGGAGDYLEPQYSSGGVGRTGARDQPQYQYQPQSQYQAQPYQQEEMRTQTGGQPRPQRFTSQAQPQMQTVQQQPKYREQQLGEPIATVTVSAQPGLQANTQTGRAGDSHMPYTAEEQRSQPSQRTISRPSFQSSEGAVQEPVKVFTSREPEVVQETQTEQVVEKFAKLITREREVHEIREVVQPIIEKRTERINVEERTEPVQEKRLHMEMSPEEKNRLEEARRQIPKPTVQIMPTQYRKEELRPTVRETIIPIVEEHITPVIQREIIQPHIIRTTIPIHERVIEAPRIAGVDIRPAISKEQYDRHGLSGNRLQTGEIRRESIGAGAGGGGSSGEESSSYASRQSQRPSSGVSGATSGTRFTSRGGSVGEETTYGDESNQRQSSGSGSGVGGVKRAASTKESDVEGQQPYHEQTTHRGDSSFGDQQQQQQQPARKFSGGDLSEKSQSYTTKGVEQRGQRDTYMARPEE